jgi:hypothetical protein
MTSGNPLRWTDPSTWPWFVYVWLAMFLAVWLKPLWRWIQSQRASGWPLTTGLIESVSVRESKQSFFASWPNGDSPRYFAELDYSYAVTDSTFTGRYQRGFSMEQEAWEFLRDLKGKSVSVQYNPENPVTSTLSEQSVETLLQTRAPKAASDLFVSVAAGPLPNWLIPFLPVFAGLSTLGLVVSLWVHVGAVTGRRVAPEALFWILHAGIFVVWFPAVFVGKQRAGNSKRKDFWKVILRGSPDWVRYLLYVFLAYAVFNFVYFFNPAPTGPEGGGGTPAIVWRGFSGHWMAFYFAGLAILYSAAKENPSDLRCLNGHPVPLNANFCTQCGQAVIHR